LSGVFAVEKNKTVAVRLEGGLGDHILGMRILPFIRKRYPAYRIIGYSDAGGAKPQLDLARLSPYLDRVIPVRHRRAHRLSSRWGSLKNIIPDDLKKIQSASLFFDAWGPKLFLGAAGHLGVSPFKIMDRRPEFVVPALVALRARKILAPFKKRIFVGLDISKMGLSYCEEKQHTIHSFLRALLEDPRVIILNFFTSGYSFPNWPRGAALRRERKVERESLRRGALWNIDPRVVNVVDAPIVTVAALLKRCRYFIGVDNGIKHLAWSLGVPLSYFLEVPPTWDYILRWMPDADSSLLFDATSGDMRKHIRKARKALNDPIAAS
jgi:hypothetical protein